jgi:hypothetical protein
MWTSNYQKMEFMAIRTHFIPKLHIEKVNMNKLSEEDMNN